MQSANDGVNQRGTPESHKYYCSSGYARLMSPRNVHAPFYFGTSRRVSRRQSILPNGSGSGDSVMSL